MKVTRDQVLNALGPGGIRSYFENELGPLSATGQKGELRENASCPFHDDETPSLSINLNSGAWICFGCKAAGGIFDFYMRRYSCEFKEAFNHFALLAGFGMDTYDKPDIIGSSTNKFEIKWNVGLLNGLSQNAKNFLQQKRSILLELIESSTHGLGSTSKAYVGRKDAEIIYDEAIIVPMWGDIDKKTIVGIQNIFLKNHHLTTAKGKPVISKRRNEIDSQPGKGWFQIGSPEAPRWYITESVIDGLSIASIRPDDFVLCLFSTTHVALLAGVVSEWKYVIACFDNDAEGERAVAKASKICAAKKASFQHVNWVGYDNGTDINDVLVKRGGNALDALLSNLTQPGQAEEAPQAVDPDSANIFDRLAMCQTLNEAVKVINENFAVISVGGKCVVMQEHIHPVFGYHDIDFWPRFDFKNFFEHIIINGTDVGSYWLKSPDRRQYSRLVFEPLPPTAEKPAKEGGEFNLWKGFHFAPDPSEDGFEEWLGLTYNVIANEDDFAFNWILTWLSDIVKNPGGEKPGTAIVLRGGRGIGKSFWAKYFGSILGQHFLHITTSDRLVNRFNFHLKYAILVFQDESAISQDKSVQSTINTILTESTTMIEPKGVNPIVVRNYIRMILASNEHYVVPAATDERRYYVLDVNPKYKGVWGFWNDLQKEFENGGPAKLLNYLMHFEPDPKYKINLRMIPKTKALLDQIVHNADSITKFWFEKLVFEDEDYFGRWYNNNGVYNSYTEFCRRSGIKDIEGKISFSKRLISICPSITAEKAWDQEIKKQARGYILPNVDTCRAEFQKGVCVDIEWDRYGFSK